MPEGGDPAEAIETLPAADERGTAKLDTAGWDPGSYEAVLTDGDGAEVARVSFYLRDPQRAARAGDRQADLRARRADRGLAGRGAPPIAGTGSASTRPTPSDPEKDDYLIWDYAGGHSAGTVPPRTAGEATLGPDSQGDPWPLPTGDYVVHYLLADQYDSAGSAEFSVR